MKWFKFAPPAVVPAAKALFLSIVTFAFLFSFTAWAEEAPKIGDAVLGLIDAIKVGGVGVILAAVVQVLKSDFAGGLLQKVNPKILPWITAVVAILGNVAHALVTSSDRPIWITILEGLLISLTSNGVFDLFKAAKSS